MYEKPLPVIDSDSRPFWDGCKAGKLLLQYSKSADKYFFYPRPFVPGTGERDVEWVEASGEGTIYSYTVAERAGPAFQDNAPFVVAVIQLKEGPRMLSNVRTDSPYDIKIGDKVKVYFDKATDDVTLPKFDLA